MNHELILHGCTPTPLASYLKALAVLRLVAEQAADPDVSGCWRDDQFVLRTPLAAHQLTDFFLERYEPTPLIAPWNGGSGFYPKDNKEGIEPLITGTSERFREYRAAIQTGQATIASFSLQESPKQEQKAAFLQRLRNQAPEPLLRWMDAAVILSDDDPRYPPLLGTGGNDGRLDFTNNFMQRLGEVLEIHSGKARPEAASLLSAALFGSATAGLTDRAIGQFSPGNAGGPNQSTGFEGAARINPWDFILMLEGAVLFAASTARRLESSGRAALSAPFTVRSRAGTEGAAAETDDDNARGEIWMPLWSAPLGLEELTVLFSEGRAALGTRPARDGLDFARAIARLGVDRGLTAFQRFGLLMRSGKAFLATPLSRVVVRRNPDADLIDDLEQRNWLAGVQAYARRDEAPNSFRAAATRLDAALFALTQRSDRAAIETVLRRAAQVEALCANSPKAREAIRPLPQLSAGWARKADDSSPEFRVAAALAGLRLRTADGRAELTMRSHLVPVSLDGREWNSNSHLVCWGPGFIETNLAAVLHRRRLEALRLGCEGEVLASRTGATLSDVRAFLDQTTDDRRIAELLSGLTCTDLSALGQPRGVADIYLPPAYALLKILFTPESLLRALKWLPVDRSLRLPAEVPARLLSGDVDAAVRVAWRRLRAIGAVLPGRAPPPTIGLDGRRLLVALMMPLTYAATASLLRQLAITPESNSVSNPEPIEDNA